MKESSPDAAVQLSCGSSRTRSRSGVSINGFGNQMLGGRRPLDLIDEGDTEAVEVAAQAFVDGAYI